MIIIMVGKEKLTLINFVIGNKFFRLHEHFSKVNIEMYHNFHLFFIIFNPLY